MFYKTPFLEQKKQYIGSYGKKFPSQHWQIAEDALTTLGNRKVASLWKTFKSKRDWTVPMELYTFTLKTFHWTSLQPIKDCLKSCSIENALIILMWFSSLVKWFYLKLSLTDSPFALKIVTFFMYIQKEQMLPRVWRYTKMAYTLAARATIYTVYNIIPILALTVL